MKSLQARLSVVLSIVATVLALLAGVGSFAAAFEQAQVIQDRRLKAIAQLFETYRLPVPRQLRSGPEAKFDAYVAVEPVGGDTPDRLFNLPAETPGGYQTATISGEGWRIFVYPEAGIDGRIAVGQRTAIRRAIAWNAGLWTAIPLLLLVPILCGLIFLLVRRMVKPISALSAGLERRTASDLGPLRANGLPSEVVPMVMAINNLLRRLDLSMEAKRRFIADAAHELRSPLAALSIQVDNVATLVSDAGTLSRIEQLRLGMARARALIEKLLALARARTPATAVPASCPLQTTLRSVLEELLPLARARDLEFHVARLEPLLVAISDLDLTLVLRNLLDNAIRYCGQFGLVEVGAWKTEEGLRIEVKDDGPGIPIAERERVFDPFYRILGSDEPGSGLGLSIVRAIVQRLGGSVKLAWAVDHPPRGLKVEVLLPVGLRPEEPSPAGTSARLRPPETVAPA